MIVDIITIGSIGGAIVTICGFLYALYRIMHRFETLEESAKCRKEESNIILKSTLAILDGLKQMNCNGPVTVAQTELKEYLFKRGD